MKKAFLVKASVMTRVVIDVENEETPTNWDIHNIIKSNFYKMVGFYTFTNQIVVIQIEKQVRLSTPSYTGYNFNQAITLSFD
jgi:hypothetical protein